MPPQSGVCALLSVIVTLEQVDSVTFPACVQRNDTFMRPMNANDVHVQRPAFVNDIPQS